MQIFRDIPIACPRCGTIMDLKEFVLDDAIILKFFPFASRAPPKLVIRDDVPNEGGARYVRGDDIIAGADLSQLRPETDADFFSIGDDCPAGLGDTGCTFGLMQRNATSPDTLGIWLWNLWDIDIDSEVPLNQDVTTDWTHYVLTYSAGYIKLYQDGLNVYSLNNPDNFGGGTHSTSYSDNMSTVNSPLIVGAHNEFSTFERYFDGKLDEVRLYSEELDATDIARLYEVTKP